MQGFEARIGHGGGRTSGAGQAASARGRRPPRACARGDNRAPDIARRCPETILDLERLIDHENPGIAVLRAWAGEPGANPSAFLPRDADLARRTLSHLGVTTRSILGAVAFETGGIVVADGLLRLWGSGPQRSLLDANRAASAAAGRALRDVLLVADDAFGGLFALDGGAFGERDAGGVFHLPADDTRWSSLEVGYSGFAAWCLTGDLDALYGPSLPWMATIRQPKPDIDRILSVYPFPWTTEGRAGGGAVRTVAADESLRLRIELCGFETG